MEKVLVVELQNHNDNTIHDVTVLLAPFKGKVSGGSKNWFIVSDPAKAMELLNSKGYKSHIFTDKDKLTAQLKEIGVEVRDNKVKKSDIDKISAFLKNL